MGDKKILLPSLLKDYQLVKLINFLLITSIFILLTIGFLHPINAINQDLGRHLLTGEIILKTQNVPKVNLFSYTYPNFQFINHHWFSEVIFYLIYSFSGFNGLLIFSTIIVVLAFFLIFFFSLKQFTRTNFFQKFDRVNNLTIITIISLLYLGVLFERTDLRPEIFSFLFLSIFIVILYSYKNKFTKWIFILPFIELLWVNMHIYFPIGIVVLALFLVDSFFSYRNNLYCRYIGILVIIFTASIFVTFLNPNGIDGAFYPFKVFQNYGYSVEENQNIFFLWNYSHKPTIIFFTISSLLLFSSLFLSIKKTKLIDWFLSIFFTLFAIFAIRNFPLFVFATFIPIAKSLSSLKVQPLNKVAPYKNVLSLILLVIVLWQIISIFSSKQFSLGIEKGASGGADFFIKNNLKGSIFNNFDIGSYLEYRLYPQEKIFVDGRPEAYPKDFFQKVYIPMQENKNIFEKVSLDYKFNIIFFSHTDQTPWADSFLRQIINNKSWKMIYLDDYAVIFIKDYKTNKHIFEKFEINQNNFKINPSLEKDIYALSRLTNFFQKAGFIEKEIEAYQKILIKKPDFCPALYNLALALNQKSDPTFTIYLKKFQMNCK